MERRLGKDSSKLEIGERGGGNGGLAEEWVRE